MSLFIENAFRVVATSAAVWIGQLAGWITIYTQWLGAQTPADQATLHAAPQIHWLPILVGFLTIVGIPIARAIAQNLGGTPKP